MSLASGRYMESLGWMSMFFFFCRRFFLFLDESLVWFCLGVSGLTSPPSAEPLVFSRRYLDQNRVTVRILSSLRPIAFLTSF